MSWHKAGVLLLGAQSCLPIPGVPAVGGVGSVLLSMARMGWKLCHVFRPYTVVDLGEAAYIMGTRIYGDRSKRLIGLSQSTYIDKVLKRFNMQDSKKDVSYALSATSRYQSDLGESHWIAVKNILKYLRRTKDMFLFYGRQEELVVNGYTDASFQTDKDDFRLQSRFVFCLNGGAVSWKSFKQDTVADSTTEAEYIAASEAAVTA
uniref:Retrotransposon protein, putative, Ty1-copia subclass n=1 Tax=Oryza sativa subsp. japonica TaxID=39947 RepID=Q10II7_ORYSJ|nr:retrotransposon protein, putative, Ty1-copia subclass [Oryza sativa Japonica Group]